MCTLDCLLLPEINTVFWVESDENFVLIKVCYE